MPVRMLILRFSSQSAIFAKTPHEEMKAAKDTIFIHIFAILHAVTAFFCRAYGLQDELMLTTLTMSLIIILCFRLRLGTNFMAAAIVVSNLAGYLLGVLISKGLWLFTANPLFVYPISTFVTTELLGWTMYAVGKFLKSHTKKTEDTSMLWLLIAFVVILVARFALILPLSDAGQRRESVNIILNYFFSCTCLICVAVYAMRYRRIADKAKINSNLAQYRYMSLKQQVNPHFLFNSLNALDCLIQENATEEASRYTHKLANIYRYMLRSGDETTLPLREEMSFVEKYTDLLRLRFPEGFEIHIDISEEDMKRKVVPCSIQLLVENATKHNAVSPSTPLRISIHSDGDSISITNNLIPKIGNYSSPSTGLGLKYIKTRYEDLSSREITTRKTTDEYFVQLPLL